MRIGPALRGRALAAGAAGGGRAAARTGGARERPGGGGRRVGTAGHSVRKRGRRTHRATAPRARLSDPAPVPPPANGPTARRAALRQLAIEQVASGAAVDSVAEGLEVTPSTVRRWLRTEPRRSGRPRQHVGRERCARILRELRACQGSTTVARLQQRLPEVPRSVLARMLRDRRRGERSRRRRRWLQLAWTEPGTVWAMDFTALGKKGEPLALCVRDLDSTKVLYAGLVGEGAADVIEPLETLFARDGRGASEIRVGEPIGDSEGTVSSSGRDGEHGAAGGCRRILRVGRREQRSSQERADPGDHGRVDSRGPHSPRSRQAQATAARGTAQCAAVRPSLAAAPTLRRCARSRAACPGGT